jgi:hypothetical protein
MTPKKTPVSGAAQWSIADIYDRFMWLHEPDLMIDNLPMLDEWYQEESPEERIARGERYADVLKKFAERYGNFISLWKTALLEYKTKTIKKYQKKAGAQDSEQLKALERMFDQQ